MEFLKIAKQMREEMRQIVDENNVDIIALFNTPKAENPRINQMILDLLYKYSRIQINKYGVFEAGNKECLVQTLCCDANLSFGDRLISKFLKTYINEIWGVFVDVKSSKVVPNGAEDFVLPKPEGKTLEDMNENSRYIDKKIGNIYLNKYRQLALFILPDGTCYYAPKDHMSLATWLNMNAIDLNGALRLEINDAHKGIDLSSLGGSQFSKSSNDDVLIEITNEQVKILSAIMKSVQLTRKKEVGIDEVLYESWGFGCSQFDYDETVGVKNINKFYYEFDEFNRNSYMKRLKELHSLKDVGEAGEDE